MSKVAPGPSPMGRQKQFPMPVRRNLSHGVPPLKPDARKYITHPVYAAGHEKAGQPIPPADSAGKYAWENLVLEGGGAKGAIYPGALAVLEEIGVLQNITRIAGASVGALTALMLAVGYSPAEMLEMFKNPETDLAGKVIDVTTACCGTHCGASLWKKIARSPIACGPSILACSPCNCCSVLSSICGNMFGCYCCGEQGYGMTPSEGIWRYLGEMCMEKTGDADITFRQLHDTYGVELIIVAANVSRGTPLYCGVKWTPDMSIRDAARMSMSLPFLLEAPVLDYDLPQTANDHMHDHFLDGGLMDNYPIQAFDGWWTTTDPTSNFFSVLGKLHDAPGVARGSKWGDGMHYNVKTIGFKAGAANGVDRCPFETGVNERRDLRCQRELPETLLRDERKLTVEQKGRLTVGTEVYYMGDNNRPNWDATPPMHGVVESIKEVDGSADGHELVYSIKLTDLHKIEVAWGPLGKTRDLVSGRSVYLSPKLLCKYKDHMVASTAQFGAIRRNSPTPVHHRDRCPRGCSGRRRQGCSGRWRRRRGGARRSQRRSSRTSTRTTRSARGGSRALRSGTRSRSAARWRRRCAGGWRRCRPRRCRPAVT